MVVEAVSTEEALGAAAFMEEAVSADTTVDMEAEAIGAAMVGIGAAMADIAAPEDLAGAASEVARSVV